MKKSIGLVFLAFVFLTILLSACAPASTPIPTATPAQPPTPLEIQALVCNGCDTTSSNGIILGYFQCTVTAKEKSNGITEVWAITYDPDSSGAVSMNVGVKKINGKWGKTDENRFNCCMDERNASVNGVQTNLGSNCSK